jgi:hypothetical protein
MKRVRLDDDERKVEEEDDIWDSHTCGYMERGITVANLNLEYDMAHDPPDHDTSFFFWGAILITGIAIEDLVTTLQLYPSRISIVDNISDQTVLARLISHGVHRMVINEGPSPNIVSSEIQGRAAPQGSWWHFRYRRHRAYIHGEIDWLYSLFPNKAKIYITKEIFPTLRLVRVMRLDEVQMYLG